MTLKPSYSALATAIAAALILSACGGGGGGGSVKSDPPPPPPPPPPPTQQTCQDTSATNYGGPLPCVYRYNGSKDNLLVPTNVDLAQDEGYTGQGVKVGVLDDAQITPYPTLDGQVAWYKDYTGQGPDPSSDLLKGHGNVMSAIIAGKPVTGFNGGVAPGADIYRARICYNNVCSYPSVQPALADLAAQGVRLFNFSIGGYGGSESANAANARNLGYYATTVLDVDGLFVALTGNDSNPNAGGSAMVPYYCRSSLATGWLSRPWRSTARASRPAWPATRISAGWRCPGVLSRPA